jgi:hypothetical protein
MKWRETIRLGLLGDISDRDVHTALSLFISNYRLSVIRELKKECGAYNCKISDYEIVIAVGLCICDIVVTSDSKSGVDIKEKAEYLAELLNKLGGAL